MRACGSQAQRKTKSGGGGKGIMGLMRLARRCNRKKREWPGRFDVALCCEFRPGGAQAEKEAKSDHSSQGDMKAANAHTGKRGGGKESHQ